MFLMKTISPIFLFNKYTEILKLVYLVGRKKIPEVKIFWPKFDL